MDFNVHATPPTGKGPDWDFDYKHLFEYFNVFPYVSTGDLVRTILSLTSTESAPMLMKQIIHIIQCKKMMV